MSESDRERQRELERVLLRSARLDAPRPSARARALEAALGAVEARGPRRALRQLGLLAGALAIAATVVLLLRAKARPPENGQLRAEPARATASASNAPAPVPPQLPPCQKVTVAHGGALLIDDFEDRNARLAIADGRDGSWMVYNDGSGKQVPPGLSPLHPERLAKARGDSHYALHTSGGKFTNWGSILVGTFADHGCYDMSAYSGIEFWAKGNTRIHIQLSVIDEISVQSGGLCSEEKDCYGSPRRPFDLEPQWRRYALSFAELLRLNEPKKYRFDPKRVVSLNISIYREDTPFDVWIDDVRFSEP
jgi:hypothetical protein